jgi:hypothetical protein
MMVLLIVLTNVPIIKRKETKKMIQIKNKCTKTIKPKRNSSRKDIAQNKLAPHQTMMEIVEVRQIGFYSWK